MQHRNDDLPLITSVINDHRPEIAIELGTDAGGFSAYLADTVAPWDGQVYTFDKERKFNPLLLDGAWPNLAFIQTDILNDTENVGRLMLEPRRCLLYCDNGHKEKELSLYAPFLKRGDMIGTHDYGTEVKPEFAYQLLEIKHRLQPVRHAEFAALANEWYPHSLTRFWRKP
jgi:cephalosporin hydroxylase